MLRKIWNFCGDVKVNFWLLLLISLNLGLGSYYLKVNFAFFNPLNHMLLQDWSREFGLRQPALTWWLSALLVLLFFLGVNTLVCALKRLISLWPLLKQTGFRSFSIRISPSLIHLCFMIILSGHLVSLIIGSNQIIPASPGTRTVLSPQLQVEVLSQSLEKYREPEAIRGRLRQISLDLNLISAQGSETRPLRFLEPVTWQGFTFHLDMARSNNPRPELKIIIKEDPGRQFIFWGFAFLIVFMLWYFPQRKSV